MREDKRHASARAIVLTADDEGGSGGKEFFLTLGDEARGKNT